MMERIDILKEIEEMRKAVEELREEYNSNKDLTAFTDLDFEEFFEPELMLGHKT